MEPAAAAQAAAGLFEPQRPPEQLGLEICGTPAHQLEGACSASCLFNRCHADARVEMPPGVATRPRLVDADAAPLAVRAPDDEARVVVVLCDRDDPAELVVSVDSCCRDEADLVRAMLGLAGDPP